MSDIERNIDWETADYFASVGPEVRWAHLRGAYRVWVERYRPFEQSGWWSFDTLDEFIAHEEQWRSTLGLGNEQDVIELRRILESRRGS